MQRRSQARAARKSQSAQQQSPAAAPTRLAIIERVAPGILRTEQSELHPPGRARFGNRGQVTGHFARRRFGNDFEKLVEPVAPDLFEARLRQKIDKLECPYQAQG